LRQNFISTVCETLNLCAVFLAFVKNLPWMQTALRFITADKRFYTKMKKLSIGNYYEFLKILG